MDGGVGVSARAQVRRAWLRQTRGRTGALRHGERAVRLYLRELLADDPPGDQRGADAAGRYGSCAVVCSRVFSAVVRAAAAASGVPGGAADASRLALPFAG